MMGEKEILDLMISERIDALLGQMSPEDWTILNRYMDHQTDRLAEEGTYLYSGSFTDGIRLMKYTAKL